MKRRPSIRIWSTTAVFVGAITSQVLAQQPPKPPPPSPGAPAQTAPRVISGAAPAGVGAPAIVATTPATPPVDYVIGPDDILSIVFWRDKDLTTDVVVRPDGKISLPVLNELQASGLTPEQLREAVLEVAAKYYTDPSVNVVVKQINSRKVFVTGEVAKPGPVPLTTRMTVIQIIAMAGGLNEYAKSDRIAVIRTEANGQTRRYRVNYKDIMDGKNLQQNIVLQVGDTVIVP